MTGKRLEFCEEYARNGENASEAALFAGYSKRSAYSQGARLLKNAEIKRKIKKLKKEYSKLHNITSSRILDMHRAIAFFDAKKLYDEKGDFKPIHDMDEETRMVIKSLHIQRVGSKIIDKVEDLTLFKNDLVKQKKKKKDNFVCFIIKVTLKDAQKSLDFLAKYKGMNKGEESTDANEQKDSIFVDGGYPADQDPHNLSIEKLEELKQQYQRKVFLRKK